MSSETPTKNTRSGCLGCLPIVIIGALVLALGFYWVSTSHKSYTMPSVTINADVRSDGTLHVIERRIFDFMGSYSAVWWDFDTVPFDSSLVVDSVKLGQGWNPTAVTLEGLDEVPFETSWRKAGGPPGKAYSIDVVGMQNGTKRVSVYVFAPAWWTKQVVQIEYEIPNFAQRYDDCADVYWQFVEPKWDVDSKSVNCTISLPVPEGESVRAADNVFAWGHKSENAPFDGEVAFDEQTGAIRFTLPKVTSGSYAEARVVFPSEWLTDAPEPSHIKQLDHIRAEEAALY